MKTDYENKQLKLNTELAGKPEGTVVNIQVDKAGTPVERYWRDRVKDAKIDNCVEFTTPKGRKQAPALKAKKPSGTGK